MMDQAWLIWRGEERHTEFLQPGRERKQAKRLVKVTKLWEGRRKKDGELQKAPRRWWSCERMEGWQSCREWRGNW